LNFFKVNIIICFLFVFLNGISQSRTFLQKQYTLEDGLPSNECHDFVQDSTGYIWIATDRGLSRFDGYGFKNYGINEGLEDLSCLRLFLDHKQNIWIITYGKNIYKYISEIDSIKPYKFNHLLKQFNDESSFLDQLYVDKNDTVYLNILGSGLLKIDPNGKPILITGNESHYTNFTYEIDDCIFHCTVNRDLSLPNKPGGELQLTLSHRNNTYVINSSIDEVKSGPTTAYKIGQDMFLLNQGERQLIIKNDKLVCNNSSNSLNHLIQLQSGAILTGQIFDVGLKLYKDYEGFLFNEYQHLIPHASVSRIFEDKDENIFVATTDKGIYYLYTNRIQNLNIDYLKGQKISAIEKSLKNELYVIKNREELVLINLDSSFAKSLYISNNELSDICIDNEFDNLAIMDLAKASYKTKNGDFKYYLEDSKNSNSTIQGKNAFRLNNKQLAVTNSRNGFVVFENSPLESKMVSKFDFKNIKILALSQLDKDVFLIGCTEGLFEYRDKRLTKLDSIHQVFNSRINDIKHVGSKYYIATQGYGLVIWDGKNTIEIVNKNTGILSNNIEKIYVNEASKIYLCTYAGLIKLENANNIDSLKIKNYTTQHGLLSNEVYDCTQIGDTLYIATGKGVSVLSDFKPTRPSKQPLIEYIIVNDNQYNNNQLPFELNHKEDNISIYFKTIKFASLGMVLYEYKLNNENWKSTHATNVHYASLGPGEYTFSVRSSNLDGQMSEVTEYQFSIMVPWWKTYWFYLLSFLILSLMAYVIYKSKIKQIEEKSKIQLEINNLERAALQAQMNPHFIFNALNSIQNFIMANNKEQAMDYLSKFAVLIRQNLKASLETKVPLDIEISMLKNYMDLEKMRFNNSFKYEITINDKINLTRIKIPHLLIQPFVENAILHGMKQKKNKGLIQLIFTKENNNLIVKIKDNGPGISNTDYIKRESLGIKITEKRLSHINTGNEYGYNIIPISDTNGTEINIEIKLN
jgi:ligand-binding sensor domain-containing protein